MSAMRSRGCDGCTITAARRRRSASAWARDCGGSTRATGSSPASPASLASEIPRRFHFVFGLRPQKEPFHLAHFLCLESCRQVNEPEEILFHCHHEPWGPYWEAIRPQLTVSRIEPEAFVRESPRYLEHPEGRFIRIHQLQYAHHSDFLRLKLLIAHGGVYADIDTLFVNRLPEALYRQPFVIGEEDPIAPQGSGTPEASLCNAFLMAVPQARFAHVWLERMYQVFDGTWSRHSCTE